VIGGSVQTTLKNCGTGASITPPVVFVAAGATVVTIIGCVRDTCSLRVSSSDVCPSDLVAGVNQLCIFDTLGTVITTAASSCQNRSEERRVGKECRFRRSTDYEKKKGLAGCIARLTYGLDDKSFVVKKKPAL